MREEERGMFLNASDYIQLIIAIIAGVGAIFAFFNIRTNNRQISLQQKQWEYMHVPTFRISYIQLFGKGVFSFVIENSNNVYHQIEKITFSSDDILITTDYYASVESTNLRGTEIISKDEYHGLIVTLKLTNGEYHNGTILISGSDALGKEFKVVSNAIEFKDYKLVNEMQLNKTYLKRI